MKLPTKTITFFTAVILIISSLQHTSSEYHEFNVTLPMILTSLRTFEKTSVQQQEPDHLYISKVKNGTAILRAEEGYGLMAVVQEMNLLNRVVDSSSPSLPQNCVDYIQISSFNGTRTTGNMCGYSVGKGKSAFKPSFVDKSGQIQLSYVISERVRLSPLDGYITNFNMSVTPFIECPEEAFPFGNKDWTPCSRIDSFSCIPADLFCDGVINCGFPGEFGLDELYCSKKKPANENQNKKTTFAPTIQLDEAFTESQETFQEIFSLSDSKNKPYDPYVAEESEVWDLDDPNAFTEHEDIRGFLPSVTYVRMGNGVGFILVLCILVSLFSTSKMRRRGSISEQQYHHDIESSGSNDSNENSKALLASTANTDEPCYFNVERDPAPPYRDCVQPNSDYNFITGLFFDHEKPPPYEEIKVHQSRPPSYRDA